MDWHFATALELVADSVPERTALICGSKTVTWSAYDDRAARIASVLTAYGLKAGANVGLYLHNSNEYLETHLGVFKIRGCPINVNYRYKEDELVYLLENADAEALVYQAAYAERIAAIRDRLPKVKCYIQVEDESGFTTLEGAVDYEAGITSVEPYPRIERSRSDLYMLYTGGTTGMPKGVMYNNGDYCEWLAKGYKNYKLQVPATVDQIPADGGRQE